MIMPSQNAGLSAGTELENHFPPLPAPAQEMPWVFIRQPETQPQQVLSEMTNQNTNPSKN